LGGYLLFISLPTSLFLRYYFYPYLQSLIFIIKINRLARKIKAVTAQTNFIKFKIFLKFYIYVRCLKFIIKPGEYDCQKYVYPARGQRCAWCAKNNYFYIKVRVNREQPESRYIAINAYFKLFFSLFSWPKFLKIRLSPPLMPPSLIFLFLTLLKLTSILFYLLNK